MRGRKPRATFARVADAVQGQESSGRVGVLGPQTQWGRAAGLMQVLPGTARQMSDKLGLSFQPDLLTAKTPEAASYQRRIGEAYLKEGMDQTGNLRDALRYYHGGPNRKLWGPKTNGYADSIMQKLR